MLDIMFVVKLLQRAYLFGSRRGDLEDHSSFMTTVQFPDPQSSKKSCLSGVNPVRQPGAVQAFSVIFNYTGLSLNYVSVGAFRHRKP